MHKSKPKPTSETTYSPDDKKLREACLKRGLIQTRDKAMMGKSRKMEWSKLGLEEWPE